MDTAILLFLLIFIGIVLFILSAQVSVLSLRVHLLEAAQEKDEMPDDLSLEAERARNGLFDDFDRGLW